VSLVVHQRDALAAEYRRVLVELKEERLRVWRPVYRNLLRVGADALRRLRAHDLLAILKRHVRDGDGIRQGVHNVSGVAPYRPARKVALSDLKPSGDRADLFIFSIVNWHYRCAHTTTTLACLASLDRLDFSNGDGDSTWPARWTGRS